MEELKSYLTNFDFEDSFKNRTFQKPSFNKLNDTLEFIFFWLCNENERLISRQNYEKNYLGYIEDLRGVTLGYTNKVVKDYLPWWGRIRNEEEWKREREINSNITAQLAREELDLNILKGQICWNKDEFESLREQYHGSLVYKEEFGFSGRGLHFDHREVRGFPLLIEPYVQRIRDFGARVGADGVSIVQNLIDTKGCYKGSFLKDTYSESEQVVKAARKVFKYYQSKFGVRCLQIDSYQYLDEGVLKYNPFCEVNHRKSMGMLASKLHQDFGNDTSLLALVNKGAMKDFSEFKKSINNLGPLDYNPIAKVGVIRLSPIDGPLSLFFLTESSERTLQYLIKAWWKAQSRTDKRLPFEFIIKF